MADAAVIDAIEKDGFVLLPAVYSSDQIDSIRSRLLVAMDAECGQTSMRSRSGAIYAARNVATWFPDALEIWSVPVLIDLLITVLGERFGLVRILYFDKHPEQTWNLPWHKDMTIAIRDNSLPSRHFAKPTLKAGVPHVEASVETLESMLTLRLHLDEVTPENGPLQVLPGSHRDKEDLRNGNHPVNVITQAGDVLAIRPLLTHASGSSHPQTQRHRRILHFEFAASPLLPDGYQWHQFVPGVRP